MDSSWRPSRRRTLATLGLGLLGVAAAPRIARATDASALESNIGLAPPGGGQPEYMALQQAMDVLRIPAVSVALIDGGRIDWVRAWGAATPGTLFQAASMSKLVTAVTALVLVQQGRLGLDADINDELTSWKLPKSRLAEGRPVTLRSLLAMRGGIGVAGFQGYVVGAKLPSLRQILDGKKPANSPAITVVAPPGSGYLYSGGGYEIVEALVQDAARQPFAQAARQLVLQPAGMMDSQFAQPLPAALAQRAARGFDRQGREVPGGWRVMPELGAAGLWTTAADLAQLLVNLMRCYQRQPGLLDPGLANEMMTPVDGGPYGLGGQVFGMGMALSLAKRGQNVGFQGYLLLFPAAGRGIVVLTNSDNGSVLAQALIQRAANAYRWPQLPPFGD
ncbi:MAG: serine hydrolase domain-containing protein [Dongiaceae bacterium]